MPDQKNAWEALSLKNHGYIEASAGTGKTYTIENLVVRILTEPHNNPWNRQIDLEELCIVTYTEKATEELRYRIRKKLEARLVECSNENRNSTILRHIQRCLTRFDRAAIYTFHGFCNRFLTAHAFESQSMFGEETLDAGPIAQMTMRDLMQKKLPAHVWSDPDKIAGTLDAWNFKGIDSFYCNVLSVIQSFNAEKADSLRPKDSRVNILEAYRKILGKYCMQKTCDHPYVIAWQSIKKSLGLKKDQPKKGLVLKALLCETNLSSAEDVIAYMKESPLDSAVIKKQSRDLFLPVVSTTSEDYRCFPLIAAHMGSYNGFSFTEFCDDLDDLHFALRENENAEKIAGLFALINQTSNDFNRKKQEHGIRTFDDMIISMHRVLCRSGNQLLPVLRKHFRYGIIDEFQDTNTLQWDIFKKIFICDQEKRSLEQRNILYVVGDPKQSIFSFQGSDVSVYLAATKELAQANAVKVDLVTNYRSSAAMVDACNCLFSAQAPRDWFVRQNSGIAYETSDSKALVPDLCVANHSIESIKKPVIVKPLYAIHPQEHFETRTKPEKQLLYAKWVCDYIVYLTTPLQNGTTPLQFPGQGIAMPRNCDLDDICILIEKHSEAIAIMKLLRMKAIPYTKQRNTGLFGSGECLQLLVALDAVDRPQNSACVKKAMLTRFVGLQAVNLGKVNDLYETPAQKLLELIYACAKLAMHEKWGEMFGTLLGKSSYFSWCKTQPDQKQRIAAMRQLRNYCIRRLIDNHDSLGELVKRLRDLYKGNISESEEEDIFQKETEGRAVKILTMHSAKGLEFPIVFLACGKGTEKNRDFYQVRNKNGGTDFWFDKEIGKEAYETDKDMESRRLYYVALTRAKYRLFVPLWDDYDLATDSIISGTRKTDSGSASSLFLSRILHLALLDKRNEALLSFEKDEDGKMENAKRHIQISLPQGSGGAQLIDKTVLTDEIVGIWPQNIPYAARRMTIQQSYSGLVRIAQRLGIRSNPGSDEMHGLEIDKSGISREDEILTPSAKTGNGLHDILELADFETWGKARNSGFLLQAGSQSKLIIENCLNARGILQKTPQDEHIINAAADCVFNSLNAVLCNDKTVAPFTLAEIPRGQRKSEAEFYFAFDKAGRPFPRDVATQNPALHGGWILGFMDLLFCHESKYYIADWKSNLIANRDYSLESIKRNMDEHRYDIQYKVYALALHWWLSQRVADYDPIKHFGGIIYVYLRGTRAGESSGIWMTKPTLHELQYEWPDFVADQLSGLRENAV